MSSFRTRRAVLCGITLAYVFAAGGEVIELALGDGPCNQGPGMAGPAVCCTQVACGDEPSIAINPRNPQELAIGFRSVGCTLDELSTPDGGLAYSLNGGQDWNVTGPVSPPCNPYPCQGNDPVLDGSRTGEGLIYYISFQQPTTSDRLNLFSVSGGNWAFETWMCGGDKPWMVIDKTGGMGCGNIYIYWSRFGEECGGRFIRLTDNQTLGTPLYRPLPQPVGTHPVWRGSMTVGPDGALYVAGDNGSNWDSGADIVVLKSINAQEPNADCQGTNPCPTFSYTTLPQCGGKVPGKGTCGGSPSTGDPNPNALLGQTWIACDTSDGPYRGYVYVLRSMRPPSGTVALDCSEATDDCGTQSRIADPMDV